MRTKSHWLLAKSLSHKSKKEHRREKTNSLSQQSKETSHQLKTTNLEAVFMFFSRCECDSSSSQANRATNVQFTQPQHYHANSLINYHTNSKPSYLLYGQRDIFEDPVFDFELVHGCLLARWISADSELMLSYRSVLYSRGRRPKQALFATFESMPVVQTVYIQTSTNCFTWS